MIPIDAARPGDLENRGFGKTIRGNQRKTYIFICFGSCDGIILRHCCVPRPKADLVQAERRLIRCKADLKEDEGRSATIVVVVVGVKHASDKQHQLQFDVGADAVRFRR